MWLWMHHFPEQRRLLARIQIFENFDDLSLCGCFSLHSRLKLEIVQFITTLFLGKLAQRIRSNTFLSEPVIYTQAKNALAQFISVNGILQQIVWFFLLEYNSDLSYFAT